MRSLTLLLLALLFPLAAAHSQVLPRVQGPGDQNWDTRFGPPAAGGMGLNGPVTDLAELPNGDIVAVGDFGNAGGDPNANYIARWDGTTWHALGTGLSLPALAVATTATGELIVGGAFTSAGGVANTSYLARWDGTAWHSLGNGPTGLNGAVTQLAIKPNGDIVAGGTFRFNRNGQPIFYLGLWNGTAWQSLGQPNLGNPMSELLVTHTGEVVIVGNLPNIGGTGSINNIAHWDGTAWRAFGQGLPGHLVAATECPNGDLVVYGLFYNGGNPAATEQYARWNGTAWQLFGGVTTEVGQVLRASPNGDLLFGGTFIDVANTPNDHGIARWDGTAWQSLGTGVASNFNNAQVHAVLVARNGDIIIGGNFNSVGDGSTLMENFGIYRATAPNGLAPVAPGAAKLTIAPNPAHGRIQATFSAGYTGPLALYDMTGRIIRTWQVSATTAQPGITLDLVGVAPGAYLLRAGTTMQRVLID